MSSTKNNLHNFETWVFFKWMFKTFCAIMIVTNTWDIIMGVFDLAQSVVGSGGGRHLIGHVASSSPRSSQTWRRA